MRARRLSMAALHGLWLGVLSHDQLAEIDEAYYSAHRDYLDEGPARSGLKRWEHAALAAHFPTRGTLAVLGAGSGREVLALIERGFAVHGFECNPRLVDVGNRLLAKDGVDQRLLLAPRDGWPEDTGPYDGIIVGWGAYMHIKGRARRVDFLRQARRRLPAGCPLLVSFLYRSKDSQYFRFSARLGDALAAVTRAEHVELGDALLPMYVHYFTREQIEAELREGGFDMVAFDLTESAGYALAVGVAR